MVQAIIEEDIQWSSIKVISPPKKYIPMFSTSLQLRFNVLLGDLESMKSCLT